MPICAIIIFFHLIKNHELYFKIECQCADWLYPGCSSCEEELRLANMFSDGMVLQREPHSPSIWGYAMAGSTVSVTIMLFDDILGTTDTVTTDSQGVWSVSLGSWPPGSGYSLMINNDGGEPLLVSDVAFGVNFWVNSNSNMQNSTQVMFGFAPASRTCSGRWRA